MINEIAERFRWVSVVNDDEEWGIKIANLGVVKTPEDFGPVPIEWTPGTIDRPICDFPNFRSNLTCFSVKAFFKYDKIIIDYGEWIELTGLNYTAFYCLKIIDAMNDSYTREYLPKTEFGSFHSPGFAPIFNREIINTKADIFRIPESISKIFVNERFVGQYSDSGFTGLEFIPVPLI